jgi:hypothetical protein
MPSAACWVRRRARGPDGRSFMGRRGAPPLVRTPLVSSIRALSFALIFFMIAGFSTELWAQSPSLNDWYSRGIIRQQTVDLMIARQQRQAYDHHRAKISRLRVLEKAGRFTSAPRANPIRPGGPASTTAPASDQDTVSTRLSPHSFPEQLAARLGKTPPERQYIQELLTKCLNFYTDTARQQGVPLHDGARALNYYIAINYFIYTQGAGPTRSRMAT